MSKITLNYLHLCDEANFSQEGKLNMLGVFDQINLTELPGGIFKATLIANITIENTKEQQDIFVNFTHEESKEQILPPVTMHISPQQSPHNNTLGFMLNLVQVTFKKEGRHLITLTHNNQTIGQLTIKVSKREIAG